MRLYRKAVDMGATTKATLLLFILVCSVAAGPAAAQNYPAKPIRLIVPFAPGGINDTVARPVAERMGSVLGTIVVENRSGAGGVIGATAAARADADGYTMLVGSAATHVIGPMIATPRPYDPVKDFKSITILAVSGFAICVHPSLPIKTLKEFTTFASANPRQLSYGSAGNGTGSHLAGELFKSLINAPGIAHVPYRGGAPMLVDLLGGHIPVGVGNINGSLIDFHRSGRLRALAVTSAGRATAAPEIPTARESGLPGMIALNFAGLFVPAATPMVIVEKIAAATRVAMSDSALLTLLTNSGLEISTDDAPDKAQRFIETEITRWSPVIKPLGLKPN
jgi:tripartite-type tricarboxylate transporter receptor subunit TctC